jgi:hypothetical protein
MINCNNLNALRIEYDSDIVYLYLIPDNDWNEIMERINKKIFSKLNFVAFEHKYIIHKYKCHNQTINYTEPELYNLKKFRNYCYDEYLKILI